MDRWTNQEKRDFLSLLQDNPGNLNKAFIAFSKKSGRTYQACSCAWYSKFGAMYEYKKNHKAFCITSPKRKLPDNVKNIIVNSAKEKWWKELESGLNRIFANVKKRRSDKKRGWRISHKS